MATPEASRPPRRAPVGDDRADRMLPRRVGPADDDPALAQRWRAQQLRMVLDVAPRLAAVTTGLALVALWLGAPALGVTVSSVWTAGLVAMVALFLADARRLRARPVEALGSRRLRWRMAAHAAALGAMPALMAALAFPQMARERQFMMGVFIGGALCVGAIEVAAVPPMALLWIGTLTIGTFAALIEVDLPVFTTGAGLLLLLAGLMASSVLGVSRALQARLRAQTEAALGEETIALLLRDFENQSDAWSWSADREGRLGEVAPRMARELGRDTPGELAGRDLVQTLRHGEGGPSLAMQQGLRDAPGPGLGDDLMRLMRALRGAAPFRAIEVAVRSPRRGTRWWSLSGAPVHDDIGLHVGWRGIVRDVTTLREQSAELERLAHEDTLTGLANRHVFQTRIHAAATALAVTPVPADADVSPLTVCLLDLDNFKSVNDHFGHMVGDRLLQEVARRLAREVAGHFSPLPGVLARLGGDEFALLVAHPLHAVEREALGLALLAALREPWRSEDLCIEVRASLGVSAWAGPGDSASRLLQQADIALYEAKAAGRDMVRVFDAAMGERMVERHLVIHELGLALEAAQRALERPDLPPAEEPSGRLSVHYQPQHDIADGSLTGFEALVRWRHPRRGWISPAQFVPVAEETGLVIALGEWVLRQACTDVSGWPGTFKIAVNLSGVQLASRSLVRTVSAVLAETRLPPQRLELEITETALLADPETARQRMHALRALGVRLGLDDFGTGYSSLSYLGSYPVNTLKVDRSFVTALEGGGERADLILRTIVQLGRGLGLTTLAEGVETPAQLEVLRRHGCVQVQGYLYAPPLPAAEAMRRCGPRYRGACEVAGLAPSA